MYTVLKDARGLCRQHGLSSLPQRRYRKQ